MSAKAIHCRDCARHFIPHETRRPTDLCWRCEGKRQQQRAAGEARCEVCNAVLAPHWLGTVCGFCTASQSGRELDWEEVDELLRKAHELRPMGNPTLTVAATSEWKDSSLDSWGRRRSGNRATPSGGNCLQGAIATALQVAPEKVPDPSPHFNGDEDWPEPYNDELARTLGIRLEEIPSHACQPPRIGPNEFWIAAVTSEDDRVGHAITCRGQFVWHDQTGEHTGSVPTHRLYYGLQIVPAGARKRDAWGAPIRA